MSTHPIITTLKRKLGICKFRHNAVELTDNAISALDRETATFVVEVTKSQMLLDEILGHLHSMRARFTHTVVH